MTFNPMQATLFLEKAAEIQLNETLICFLKEHRDLAVQKQSTFIPREWSYIFSLFSSFSEERVALHVKEITDRFYQSFDQTEADTLIQQILSCPVSFVR